MAKTKLENLIGNFKEIIKPTAGYKPTKAEQATIEMVNAVSREARKARQAKIINDDRNIEEWWTLCGRRWLGDHHDRKPMQGMVQFTVNRDGNAIEANVADQTLKPFRPRFMAVEIDDEPTYFISNRAAKTLLEIRTVDLEAGEGQMAYPELEALRDEQLGGLEPIDSRQARIIQKMTEPMMNPETGEVVTSPLDHRAVLAINDAYRANILQKVFDRKWSQSAGDSYIAENETLSNIFGSAALWFQVNQEENWRFEFVNPENMNVLADPKNTRIERFNHLQIIEVVPLQQAIGAMPKHETKLKQAQVQGTLTDTEEIPLGSTSSETDYQIPQVILKHTWIRNQRYPMSEQQALRSRKVMALEEGEGVQYLLIETNEPTSPNAANWPDAPGVRYIKSLVGVDAVLEDTKSPYSDGSRSDMPIAWNKNRMIQHDPHGMGEPHRTFDLQNSINFVGQVLINRLLYSQYPIEMWPESLRKQYEGRGDSTPRLHPGRRLWVSDETWAMGARNGWQGFLVAPPEVPTHLVAFWADLKAEHDRQSISTPARQGQLPSAGTSGKALDTLVAQASGPVAMRARFTEEMVERTSRMLMQFLVDHMPEQEWASYCSELTEAAFSVIWAKFRSLDFDVDSEIVAGKGHSRLVEEQKASEDLTAGAISMQTYRQKRGIEDSEGEDRRIVDRQRKLQSAAAQPQQPMEQGQ